MVVITIDLCYVIMIALFHLLSFTANDLHNY